MASSRSSVGLAVVVALCLGAVGALAYYVKTEQTKIPTEELKPKYADERRLREGINVPKPTISDNGSIQFEKESAKVPKGSDSRLVAVNAFMESLGPEAPKAQSVSIRDSVAQIDFPAGSTFSFGSTDEATFLLGLRSAMGQFAEIEAIEIFVAGRKLEEMGHELIEAPMKVIRPENWKSPLDRGAAPTPSEGR